MQITIKIIFLLFFAACCSLYSYGQSTFSIEILTVGVHAFDKPNFKLFENALDEQGNVCAEPGLSLSYESFVSENRASFQLTQAIFADAAGQLAGYTEISFRRLIFHKWRSNIYLGVGPALTYRNSWAKLSYGSIIYEPETNYYHDGNWEIKPYVIGKLEYDVFIGNNSDLLLGIIYGHSYNSFTATLGYRYWISTKVRHSKGCDCKNKYRKKFKDYFW
jgi:hypothetical protein